MCSNVLIFIFSDDVSEVKSYRESRLLIILKEIIETIKKTLNIDCSYKTIRYILIQPNDIDINNSQEPDSNELYLMNKNEYIDNSFTYILSNK